MNRYACATVLMVRKSLSSLASGVEWLIHARIVLIFEEIMQQTMPPIDYFWCK